MNPNENNLIYISGTSLVLGVIIAIALITRSKSSGYYFLLSLFHLNEFWCNAKYSKNVTHDSFLIFNNTGSKEYWMVQMITIAETIIFRRRSIKLGFFISVLGLGLRFLSIKTLGLSFSHYIKTEKVPLVTGGVYQYTRHPSYVGFYLYVMGIQIYLRNYGCLLICLVILTKFMKKRIQFEEYWLMRNHLEYEEYRERVGVWIPFV